jgi:hypothetical protein
MVTYNEFIFERLISESVFQYSDGFHKILSRINLPIAKSLIGIKGKDINAPQNYIDIILDEDDMITFISDAKASEILDKREILYIVSDEEKFLTKSIKNKDTFDRLGVQLDGDFFNGPEEDDIGRIIAETIGNNGSSYVLFEYTSPVDAGKVGKKGVLNKNCLSPTEEIDLSKLWGSNRNKVKVGRFVRSVLKANDISFNDRDIEGFVNSYKSEIELINNAFMKFDVVEGNLIAKYYNHETYKLSLNGTLGNSCMKNKSDDYFDIYVENPDKVKLVILYDENGSISDGKYTSSRIQARALLWKTDQGDMIMDRIYTNYDKDVELFKKFAEKNDWWSKKHQNSSCNFVAQRGEDSKNPIYTIKVSKFDFDYYPYLDTFPYFDKVNGILTNQESRSGITHIMGNTDGSISPK